MKSPSDFFRRASAIAAGACALALCVFPAQGAERHPDPDAQQLFIGENIAVAQTAYGKVRGFVLRDIFCFRGIPYGADTGGENRFMPPRPPEAWEGVRPAVAYGASAPQSYYDRRPESYSMFVDHWNYDLMGEDCLRLNVWTPALDDGKRRPVLVWLHGGAFARGNGIEQDSYDGENIARYGDIVFCSVNHRLNAFGFSDFASVGGEKYRRSGNVGMLDIVAALQWVHDNIANFGGDPTNVTIMGQSGGASKVCLLAAMPAAKGLFHKAVALSGDATRANDAAYAERLGETILREAGSTPRASTNCSACPGKHTWSWPNAPGSAWPTRSRAIARASHPWPTTSTFRKAPSTRAETSRQAPTSRCFFAPPTTSGTPTATNRNSKRSRSTA